MKKLVIIGIGGIGSHLLLPLFQYLNYVDNKFERVLLVDGDIYEEKNLSRQHVPDFSNKARAQVKHYRELFKNIILTPIDVYIKPDNIESIIKDGDVVLLCVDNNKTRIMIEEYVDKLKNVTIISGGNELHDGNVMIMHKENDVLITPKFSDLHPEISNGTDKRPDEMSCDELSISEPQIGIVNATIADNMRVILYAMLNKGVRYYESFVNCLTGNIRLIKFDEPDKLLKIDFNTKKD